MDTLALVKGQHLCRVQLFWTIQPPWNILLPHIGVTSAHVLLDLFPMKFTRTNPA